MGGKFIQMVIIILVFGKIVCTMEKAGWYLKLKTLELSNRKAFLNMDNSLANLHDKNLHQI